MDLTEFDGSSSARSLNRAQTQCGGRPLRRRKSGSRGLAAGRCPETSASRIPDWAIADEVIE